MTLQVHDGYFGHFKSKTYFDHFEAFRGTFITLDVYGYFGNFLYLMAYSAILNGRIVSTG